METGQYSWVLVDILAVFTQVELGSVRGRHLLLVTCIGLYKLIVFQSAIMLWNKPIFLIELLSKI